MRVLSCYLFALLFLWVPFIAGLNYQENILAPTKKPTSAPTPKRIRKFAGDELLTSDAVSPLAPKEDSAQEHSTPDITSSAAESDSNNGEHFQVDSPEARAAVAALPGIDDSLEGKTLNYGHFKASYDFECLLDDELERMVHTPGTRVRLFMFYHSNRTEFVVKRYAFCKDWIFPYFLNKSPYMESQVYRDLFKPNLESWKNEVDYIITCTYRHALFNTHTQIVTPLTNEHIKELIYGAQVNNSDVVPLEVYPRSTILVSLHLCHGMNSIRAWNFLLIKMGFTTEELDSCKNIYGFWRSSYMIRPTILAKLTDLVLKAMDLVDHDPRIISVFKKDAKYGAGDPIVAYQVFGTPYYQMHPFIFERLPAFFLTAINANVPGLVTEQYHRPAFANFSSS